MGSLYFSKDSFGIKYPPKGWCAIKERNQTNDIFEQGMFGIFFFLKYNSTNM